MTSEFNHPNVQLLEKIFAAFNSGDAERVAAFFSKDAKSYSPAGPMLCGDLFEGRDAIRTGVAGRFKILYDVKWIERVYEIAGEDAVFVRWRMVGTGPDGEAINTLGCEFWRFRDGEATLKDTYYKKVD